MKITAIETIELAFEPKYGSNCLVRVTTDGGISGLGQAGGFGYPRAVGEVIQTLTSVLVGQDPFRTERLWHLMYRAGHVRGNLLTSAIGALEIALWDIKGKALDVPVWELLGGRARERVRLHAIANGAGPEELGNAVAAAAAEGFTAVKFDPLLHLGDDVSLPDRIESACAMADAAREASGPAVDLIFEMHGKLDPLEGLAMANALARFQPLFIEDPIQVDSIRTQADVCARISHPVAVGERLSTIWEFRELLSYGVPIHLRPDVGIAGGLGQAKKIASLAEAYSCGIVPHNWRGPASTAATLHLCVAIPNLITMEYLQREEDVTSSSAAVRTVAKREGGFMIVPDEPGLGIELADDYERFVPERRTAVE